MITCGRCGKNETSPLESLASSELALQHAEALMELTQHPSWALYVEVLKAQRIAARDSAMESEPAMLPYWQGVVSGLRAAAGVPFVVAQGWRAQVEAAGASGKLVEFPRGLTGDPD